MQTVGKQRAATVQMMAAQEEMAGPAQPSKAHSTRDDSASLARRILTAAGWLFVLLLFVALVFLVMAIPEAV